MLSSSSSGSSSNSNRNSMFDTNDILNITIRANIQLLWLLSLKTKIAMRFDVVVLGHTVQNTLHIVKAQPYRRNWWLFATFLLFMEPFMWVYACVFASFHLLIFCTICLVVSFWSKWIDFFFYVLVFFPISLSTFAFLRHLSFVQKLGPSIVMTTHNSYNIIASISGWRGLSNRGYSSFSLRLLCSFFVENY